MASSTFDITPRYSDGYEESVNPFKQFTVKERQRKYANLNPADKMALSMSRFIFSNKQAGGLFSLGFSHETLGQ